MKIKKVITPKVYKRFKIMVLICFTLLGMNYISDRTVKDMAAVISEGPLDLSEYGIYVNADEDEIENGE